jgi:hypothetical protein
MPAIEERVSQVESALARFMDQSAMVIASIREEIAEMRASSARTERQLLELRQQSEKDRKDFNKRMAEISESMGTLIEDMVAPCGFQLARTIFRTEDAETCAPRIKRRLRGEMMEIDLLAIGATKVLVVEAKRRVDASKVTDVKQKLARVPEFFPELSSKTLYGAVASVYLDASVVACLNREKLYGIAMGNELMEVVNLAQF